MTRTTLDLEDHLLAEAKALAAREKTSLTRIVERGLAMQLRSGSPARTPGRPRPPLPVYPGRGGLRPAVRDPRRQGDREDAADGIE